jgi:hypothetical protein
MNAFVAGPICFVCLVGAALLGIWVSRRLPDHHLSRDAKDVINLSTAVIGTLAALALGLLISSAKTTYENANTELKTSVAHVVLLDRVMSQYGPETMGARADLRKLVENRLARAWNSDPASSSNGDRDPGLETVEKSLRELMPDSSPKKLLQARVLKICDDIDEGYWLQTETVGGGLPGPFLIILVFWLAVLFATFGLLAPVNTTVMVTLMTCAISVAAAIYLIVDMDHPYVGFIHISDEPLRAALQQLGRP